MLLNILEFQNLTSFLNSHFLLSLAVVSSPVLLFLVMFITLKGLLTNLGSVHMEVLSPTPGCLTRHQGCMDSCPNFPLWPHLPVFLCPHAFHTWEVTCLDIQSISHFTHLCPACPSPHGILLAQLPVQRHHAIVSRGQVPHSTFLTLSWVLEPVHLFFLIAFRDAGFYTKG